MKRYEIYNERRANIDNIQVEHINDQQKDRIFNRVKNRISFLIIRNGMEVTQELKASR